jgi:hypothetical protein
MPHCVRDESKPGGFRLCGDYRGLNKRTVMDRYPSDVPDRVYDLIRRADITTKMDGTEGYFAIPIHPDDKHKTAIRLPITESTWGLFELNVALFGLCNAGASYDRFMNRVIAELDMSNVLSFRDDIFVSTIRAPGESDESLRVRHLEEVKRVVAHIKKRGGRLKPKKLCLGVLAAEPLDALGYVVQHHRLRRREEDVANVRDFPIPKSKLELQRFLGAVEWVRRYIPALARTERPLTDAGVMPDDIKAENAKRRELKQRQVLNWPLELGQEALAAFEATKRAVAEAMELAAFSFNDEEWETQLGVDAGGGAIAGVLLQKRRHGPPLYQIIACCSRRMTPAEMNYLPGEQELLAIYFAVTQWMDLIEGRKLVVLSDHQSLEFMSEQVQEQSRGRMTRWFLCMQHLRMEVRHIPGRLNEFPDALSRMFEESSAREEPMGDSERVATVRCLLGDAAELVVSNELLDIVAEQSRCPETVAIRHWIAHGKLPDAWVGSQAPRADLLKRTVAHSAAKFTENHDVLYVRGKSQRFRLVVPVSVRRALLQCYHDAPTGGHRGTQATVERLRAKYWWPGLRADVAAYVEACSTCERTKRAWPAVGDLQPLDVTKVFEYLHLDLIGPLPETLSGSRYIFVGLDRATNRVVLIPLPNKEGRTIARALVKLICWHGSAPAVIQSDQGKEFLNAVVQNASQLLGMHHVVGAAYHPQTNGKVERRNLPIEQMLAIFGDLEQRTWDQNLDFVMYALNNTRSEVTGETPNFLCWGRRALEPMDLLLGVDPDPVMSREHWLDRLKVAREIAAQANEEAIARMKARADKGAEPHALGVGDTVWVQEKRVPIGLSAKLRPKAANVEYEVKELKGGGGKHAVVAAVNNPRDERKVHVERLKPVKREPSGLFGEAEVPQEQLESDRFEVDRVLDHRSDKGVVKYLVRWRGFGPQDDSWVKESDLQADECLAEYKRQKANAELRVVEPRVLSYAEVVVKPASRSMPARAAKKGRGTK